MRRFITALAEAVYEDVAKTELSPVTRAMIAAYFDGSYSEAKRYADHHFATYRNNPTWVTELAIHE